MMSQTATTRTYTAHDDRNATSRQTIRAIAPHLAWGRHTVQRYARGREVPGFACISDG
jgi:hypothetical protein